ncbi:hypothetical protein SAMN02910453_1394 [Lachnospiraceae bacterium A10]|nr:hypothetical protein SAMN02910453_1394 [Lachnospiraceae bacterium A10]
MKKIKGIIITITLTICLCMTGCAKEPEKIELTGDNLEEYFILDASVDNVDIHKVTGLVSAEWAATADLNATAKLKKDVDVEDVVIEGYITTTGLCWTNQKFSFKLQVDKDGYGEASERMEPLSDNIGESSLLKPDYPSIKTISNDQLSEGESLAMDGNIVITSVSGYIYESEE